MKKAQWKQDPRERSFGKDPRDVLNDNLTKALHEANEKIAMLKETRRAEHAVMDQQRDQLLTRNKRERAYTWLRAKGVVVEDEGEFKHLQGSDMDKFFGIDLRPATPPSDTQWFSISEHLSAQFKKAYQQSLLYGTGATHIIHDELQVFSWQAPQKRS